MIINTKNYKGVRAEDKNGYNFIMAYYDENSNAKTATEIVNEIMKLGVTCRMMTGAEAFTRHYNCDTMTIKKVSDELKKMEIRNYIDFTIPIGGYSITLVYNNRIA